MRLTAPGHEDRGLAPRPGGEIDTEPHPRFPLYSAGNFAEVAPHRLSIVSWSLLGPPVEASLRDLAARIWPRARWYTGSHYVFVGYVACRPYHNLSALCHMARHIPGLRARDVTSSYFEDTPPPEGPPGLQPRSREQALVPPRLLREVVTLAPRIGELEGRVARAEGRARTSLASGNPLLLGETFRLAREGVRQAWALHYLTTLILVPLRRALGTLGRRLTDHWSEIEPWVGQPEQVVWTSLHGLRGLDLPLGPAEFLDRAFYEVADDHEPWSSYCRPRPADDRPGRLAEGTPAGTGAVVTGGRARRGSVWPGNRVLWDIEPRLRRRGLPLLVQIYTDTLQRRELTKSLAMRSLHVCRRLIPPVANLVGVAARDWPYLTVGELAGAHPAQELRSRAERRQEACAAALERAAPESLDTANLGKPVRQPSRPGRGVSPGLVMGVVVREPSADGARGEQARILVCESADAEIQPFLPHIDGVVTARGSALSHLSIIVREHGIPAVVGHPLALTLRPGQLVSMNGTTGEVSVLD